MASGIFALLDDIAALMDDIAINSKIAAQKTAGILGDDLAVNAEKATGFVSSRELPVLWAITKGSFLNKLIIVPIIMLLQAYLPWAIQIILLLGGFYLAYEGVEKIVVYFFHKKTEVQPLKVLPLEQSAASEEPAKIKSAIQTDFILSIEIVIIALSTVLDKELTTQIFTVAIVSVVATIGVYGIVALIVRMDDAGFFLIEKTSNRGFLALLGRGLVQLLPKLIQLLAVVGTLALLLVSGGIFHHQLHFLHDISKDVSEMLLNFILGTIGGLIAFALVFVAKKIGALFYNRRKP